MGWQWGRGWLSQVGASVLALALAGYLHGQVEVIPYHQDRPPGPPRSPAEAIAAMAVPEGFTVELVASEPEIVNPVAMTFDERGRIWITESLEYPRREPGPGRDRVKVLEDTDGDGRADRFTVFAEGLNIPSGIAVGYGGVWVANAPDILLLKDTDGDGRADQREVIVTGFGRADTHELPNSLSWGPDGYLYGLNGVFNPSHVRYTQGNPNYRPEHPGWQFTCAMFRIHPVTRTFELFCEGTSNPWGIAWDLEGSAFVSACVIDHLWHLTETGYYHRQGGPYPPFTWKLGSIVQHTHQKAAYCGLHYFDSDAYPPAYRGKLYMGNIHGGCINADELHRRGSTYLATPRPDLLTAHDPWFMPVSQKTGPDGCLYLLDWYDRYHCYQDANRDPAGIDRLKGRLYRLRYGQTPRAVGLDLAAESDEQLLARLGAPNDFLRHTAQRLLTERYWQARQGDPARAQRLRQQLEALALSPSAELPQRRHALFTLVSGQPLDEATLLRLLAADDPVVRAWGVRAVGNQRTASTAIAQRLEQLATDSQRPVQLQVAIAAGKLPQIDPLPLWVEVLATCGDDPLIPAIVWQNLHPRLPDRADAFVHLLRADALAHAPGLAAVVPRAIERLLALDPLPARAIAGLWHVLRVAQPEAAQQTLLLVAERLQTGQLRGPAREALKDALAPELAPLRQAPPDDPLHLAAALVAISWGDRTEVELVRQALADPQREPAVRLAALAALVAASDRQVLPAVLKVLHANPPKELAAGVLALLGRLEQAEVADELMRMYAQLPPDLQPRVIELLTQRPVWGRAVVQALAAGQLPAAALNVNQVQRLLATGDAAIQQAIERYWGTVRTTRDPRREQVVAEMRRLLRLSSGDPQRGREVYRRLCAQCHRLFGEGQDVGPDLTHNGRSSLDQLVSNVFDPSLVIGAAYQARTVLTTDGRILTGLLVEDSPQRVVLKLQGGKLETIPREDVEQLRVSELSLMPEGLEKQLQPQEIADLFAFLLLEKPPAPASPTTPPGTP